MARDPYRYFRIEAAELFEQIGRATLDLEKKPSQDILVRLLRAAHTLKGAARVVKRADIGDCAHGIEDTLAPLRGVEPVRASREQIDAILGYLDQIGELIATLSNPEHAGLAGEAVSQAAIIQPASVSRAADIHTLAIEPQALRTVRVELGEMDRLLNGFVEVHSQLGSLRTHLNRMEMLRDTNEASGARDMTEALDDLHRNLTSGIDLLDREFKQVREAAERIRLVPADSIFIGLERAARDAAEIHNKNIVFKGEGGDIRVDAGVLDTVQVALAHAVRNAVVHGIEDTSARTALGKSAAGAVTITIVQRGKDIIFTCADDGRGINFDAVRAVARQRGLIGVDDAAMDSAALLRLLLQGGMSTLETVSKVAGRGIGLDVVRDAVQRLGGTVGLSSNTGDGTAVKLIVPLTIAALDGLQVQAAGVIATIPLSAVRCTQRIAPGDIIRTAAGVSILYDGTCVPFIMLEKILEPYNVLTQPERNCSAIIVEVRGRVAAIGADRLIGTNSIVVRPLPALAPASKMVAGVSLDVEGNPQLVFDPEYLVMAALAPGVAADNFQQVRNPILVVDDSLTTRMLERSILESAGYDVELAVSAEDALEKAANSRYALFLVDVEMPGMDGFTFIEHIRANAALREIPAILVTSLASPENFQRGKDVGANDYIVKSEFDQRALLKRIRELVG